jgi:hypothetical protein
MLEPAAQFIITATKQLMAGESFEHILHDYHSFTCLCSRSPVDNSSQQPVRATPTSPSKRSAHEPHDPLKGDMFLEVPQTPGKNSLSVLIVCLHKIY